MGMLFNTPDTEQIVARLNRRYDDKVPGLPANRGDAAVYLDFVTYPTLSSVATQLNLLPGNPRGNRRWIWFLDFIDGMQGPNLVTIAVDLRNVIATACNDQNCASIEFFAVPDTNISLYMSYIGLGGGRYSRIITLYTTLIDRLGAPQ